MDTSTKDKFILTIMKDPGYEEVLKEFERLLPPVKIIEIPSKTYEINLDFLETIIN